MSSAVAHLEPDGAKAAVPNLLDLCFVRMLGSRLR